MSSQSSPSQFSSSQFSPGPTYAQPAKATPSAAAALAVAELWQRRKLWLLGALLFAITLLLYGPVVTHRFINLDDDQYVTGNPHVIPGLTANGAAWAFRNFDTGNWHPLAWLAHMLDCQLFGLNPAGHHYSSVLLHALNALLLFVLLARATGATGRSFLVAALFAVHPLNVESVAWVAERKTLISTFFSLLTIAAYGWYASSRGWLRYLATLFCFVLALMGKAMPVTLPVLLLVIDYWPLERLGAPPAANADPINVANRPAVQRLLLEKFPLLAISLVFSGLAVIAQHSTGSLALALPLKRRLQNAVLAYAAYIGKALWPARLSVFYPYAPGAPSGKALGLALLLLLVLSGLSLWLRRERYLAAGWIWFLVALLPVIGIVQVGGQAMADRYSYTPLIGLFVMAVWGGDALRRLLRLPAAPLAVAAVCALAMLAAVTRGTLSYWQNSLTLFAHARQVVGRPDELIETNLGEAYSAAGQPEEALHHFETARALNPSCYLALYNIGNYLLEHGRAGESVAQFQAAIQYSRSPQTTLFAQANLGEAELLLGDNAAAQRAFAQALRLDPASFVALLGHGQALLRLKRYDEAESDFSQLLRARPQAELFYLEGMALEGEQKIGLAIEAYRQALIYDPAIPQAKARIAALENSSAVPSSKPGRAPR